MPKKKNSTSQVAKAAAAAAAAAVAGAAAQDEGKVWLFSNDDDEDDDDGQLNDEIMEGISQMDESAAGEIVWWELYCDSPMDKAGMIRKLGTSELKGLREECLSHGPGEYHVIARTKRGRFVKGSRQKIKISGFARAPTTPNAAATPAIDPLTFMAQLEDRMERRRLAARAERNQEIKFWAPIIAPIAIEFAKGLFGRGSGESMKDLVGALVGMKDLVGAGAGDKQVDTLLKGIELARELEPKSTGSTWPDVIGNGLGTLAREFRPLAETLAKNRNGQQPAPAAGALQFQTAPATPQATLPASSASETPPTSETPATQDNGMLTMVEPMLRKLAADLEDFATNAADPGLAAEALLAKIPRQLKAMVQPDQVKEWLTQPDWWQVTSKFHPPLQPYEGFCDQVRLSILEQLDPTATEGEQPE